MDPLVRAQTVRIGALGLSCALILGTSWAGPVAFLALGALALVAWIPRVGPWALTRVGWTGIPVVGALVGVKASGFLVGAAFTTLIAGAVFAPPPSSSTTASSLVGTASTATARASSPAGAASIASASLVIPPSPASNAQVAASTPTVTPPPTSAPPSPTKTPVVTTAPPVTAQPTTARPATPAPTTAQPTTAPAAAASLAITQLHYDGAVPRTESDEYVQITNRGGAAQSMAGWKIVSVRAGQTYAFPNVTIAAGQTCRVYTNETHPEWCSLSWGRGSAVWNNAGDRANLVDPGGIVVSTVGYSGY